MEKQLQFIEVCAGCGGLSSGFINKGFFPIALIENNEKCCETLNINHSDINIMCNDMRDIDFNNNVADIIIGGVPCQSFSQAGKRLGLDDDRGNLIIEFYNIIEQNTPKVFMIENVKGLLTHNNGETFKEIIDKFEKIGKYNIYYKILNVNDYRVPQKRERLFIVGVDKKIKKKFIFPEPNKYKPILQDVLENVPVSDGYEYPKRKKEIMNMIPQGGCWINLPIDIQKEYMKNSLQSGGGKRGIARRLSMNEACLTLTTSPCQKQTERCHPLETRPLNIREYARIQTFPDNYKFSGSIAQQYKQIGNAVPVKLAEAIAESIKNVLS